MADLSDYLPLALQASSTILSAGGQYARGQSYRTIAARRRALGEFEAQQLEAEATQSRGVGLRAAQDEILKAKLVNSTALARAAASGAGASDPTVMAILARTAGEGAYRSAVAMYEGEAQARLDMMRAAALRFEGATAASDAETASRLATGGAAATLLTGGLKALSMYDKYWSGPKPEASAMPIATGITSAGSNGSWLDTGSEIMDTFV